VFYTVVIVNKKDNDKAVVEQMSDQDVSEWDAAVSVSINSAVDFFDEVSARSRQLWSDDVEQVADNDLSIAARVEEGAQLFEFVCAQQHAKVDQTELQCFTWDPSRRAAPAVYLFTFTVGNCDE